MSVATWPSVDLFEISKSRAAEMLKFGVKTADEESETSSEGRCKLGIDCVCPVAVKSCHEHTGTFLHSSSTKKI